MPRLKENDLSSPADSIFELLYPAVPAELPADATGLVAQWAAGSPAEAARQLATYAQEAEQQGRRGQGRLLAFCR
ncbi:MAG TPA: hypothetical protein VMM92_08720, partial [Thermoanaerobaculia bacterium]|nr:hypothetical protein [Thermoanaerobaculia bacterium]